MDVQYEKTDERFRFDGCVEKRTLDALDAVVLLLQA